MGICVFRIIIAILKLYSLANRTRGIELILISFSQGGRMNFAVLPNSSYKN